MNTSKIIIVVLTTTALFAQIEGVVRNAETGIPIANVNIFSGEIGTVSDGEGRFQLDIAPGSRIVFAHIAYKKIRTQAQAGFWEVTMIANVLLGSKVVVRSGLSNEELQKSTTSVTVLDALMLSNKEGSHFQSIINDIPNLNWAGGTSRPRYFQIRGIGERSHYFSGGPPNFSVGFIMDDIDLSGIGMAGLLFDLDQVEVFKGPQSSVFGPNALAGLISLRSATPVQSFKGAVHLGGGTYATRRINTMINVPLTDRIALRAAYSSNYVDGFRTNVFLKETDTNQRKESLLREKLFIRATDNVNLTFTVMNAVLDNGYDAWATDNNEDLITYSNDRGQDSQRTNAFSLRTNVRYNDLYTTLILSKSETEMVHSYDGDWGNDTFWALPPYNFDPNVEGYRYEFFDRTDRTRETTTLEARFAYKEFILGLYQKQLTETDAASGWLHGGIATQATSDFDLNTSAIYSQYEFWLDEKIKFLGNIRYEKTELKYTGTTFIDTSLTVKRDVTQPTIGAKGVMQYVLSKKLNAYASVARGYKSGGVNQHPYLAEANRIYDPETIMNFEIGLRHYTDNSMARLTAFTAKREDQQVSISAQQHAGDPNSFYYFTANATRGTIGGVEFEGKYRMNSALKFTAAMGIINSRVDAFYFDSDSVGDRELAHAPNVSYSISMDYKLPAGFFANLNLSGKDKFYFSDSHDERSEPYHLLNGHLGYRRGRWSLKVWGQNIFDTRYAVRGFYFGLEPPDYTDKLYVQWGDPARVGITVKYTID